MYEKHMGMEAVGSRLQDTIGERLAKDHLIQNRVVVGI